ncbi:DUF2851 family protein [Psychroserpens burtonensis]|uniref:DUF2851 family protein n=1 Tax=Psychroserpens burtonensis TaxID=49278 RepID=A0A5C7B5P1_9FLAO|nr:DUF2851 family protein [Psychroserpens burtonensis]TXE15752.1 DUF2851 family protein [Psychroserpens burtonensis]
MKEDFLHYLWLHKKLDILHLKTTHHECLEIVSVGQHNHNSGPDFFNGQIRIGEQLWAGNIEIHIKSSDWFVHGHEQDPAYDNVILHVVYEHDTDIFRHDNSAIPTLELKKFIDSSLLDNYYKLFSSKKKWINCEQDFPNVDEFTLKNWQERLYFERLERKSKTIEGLLKVSKNDWEAVLFKLLAKNFGLKVNGASFASIANSIEFSTVRKSSSKLEQLEALVFGQAGLLEKDSNTSYYETLQEEYKFLKQKFQLNTQGVVDVRFFRLRPPNFPTIRLSQLANLYHKEQQLFSRVISAENLSEIYMLFEVSTSPFWKTHYTFDKESKQSNKKVTKAFVDLLLINTILPIKFCYAKQNGEANDETLLEIVNAIATEKNSIIDGFSQLKHKPKSALESQAFIQLKTEYCDKNKCLQCAIGNTLLTK